MPLKALLVAILLGLLFYKSPQVIGAGDTFITYKPHPPKMVALVEPPVTVQEAVQPIVEAPVITYTAPVLNTVIAGCGDNYYANYIYEHESGCSTTIRNQLGCLGIGQACPGSKLTAVCPNLDYACENSFFTVYSQKYGGWLGSYNFWVVNHWW